MMTHETRHSSLRCDTRAARDGGGGWCYHERMRLRAPIPDPQHRALAAALAAALRRRAARLSALDVGRLVACEVDAAYRPLEPERVAWLRSMLEALGADLQPLTGKVLDFGAMPVRPDR